MKMDMRVVFDDCEVIFDDCGRQILVFHKLAFSTIWKNANIWTQIFAVQGTNICFKDYVWSFQKCMTKKQIFVWEYTNICILTITLLRISTHLWKCTNMGTLYRPGQISRDVQCLRWVCAARWTIEPFLYQAYIHINLCREYTYFHTSSLSHKFVSV